MNEEELPFAQPIKLYTEVSADGVRKQVYLGEAYQTASGYFARTDIGILPADSIEEAINLVSQFMDLNARGLRQFDPKIVAKQTDDGLMSLREVVGILLWGKDLKEVIKDRKCMTCPCDVDTFKDAKSLKEYGQSGMCQHCQDSVFG